MRELKFRAWLKNYNCYAEVLGFDRGKLIVHLQTGELVRHRLYVPLNDCILEQSTGLKDENGKGIYEGDIIQEEIDFNSKMTDGVFTYVVEWDNDTLSYGLRGSGNSIHDELWEVNASVEIVGNIHENPELLEEGK